MANTYQISLNLKTEGLYSYIDNNKVYLRVRKSTWENSELISLSDFGYDSLKISYTDGISLNTQSLLWKITTDSIGGEGDNWLSAAATGNSVLSGLAGNDHLMGRDGNDYLNGGSGNDTLIGGGGADTLLGGTGDDLYTIWNGSGADLIIDEGGTNDVLDFRTNDGNGYSGNLTTYRQGTSLFFKSYFGYDAADFDTGEIKNFQSSGYIENLRYINGAGVSYKIALAKNDLGSIKADWISATASGNNLSGLAGDDVLIGFIGKDTLTGGVGNDVLYGSDGADKFVFSFAPNVKTNVDYIVDFSHDEDKIQLSQKIFTGLSKPAGTSSVLSEGAFGDGKSSSTTLTERIIYDQTAGYLYYDADGSKASGKDAVIIAVIGNKAQLSATDFEIII